MPRAFRSGFSIAIPTYPPPRPISARASGAVWMRGQELEFKKDTPEYRDTLDRTGKSWLDLLGDDAAQMEMFGKVMFRPGPWPGAGFEVPEAQKAEEQRGRKPPRLGDKI